jgi:hypothetical protein
MSFPKILLAVVLADYAALCGYAIYTEGVSGLIAAATASPMAWAITADLCIALTLAVIWMRRDARARGISVMPYALLTVFLGSVGPLAYLLRRPEAESHPSLASVVAANRSLA